MDDDAKAFYRRACEHDRAGREAEAIPEYRRALALGLGEEERRGALVGLGSSLRNVGMADESVAILRAAAAEYPDDAALASFLALASWSKGDARGAVSLLLELAIRFAPVGDYADALRRYRAAL